MLWTHTPINPFLQVYFWVILWRVTCRRHCILLLRLLRVPLNSFFNFGLFNTLVLRISQCDTINCDAHSIQYWWQLHLFLLCLFEALAIGVLCEYSNVVARSNLYFLRHVAIQVNCLLWLNKEDIEEGSLATAHIIGTAGEVNDGVALVTAVL